MRSPTRIPRLCACGARATTDGQCATCEEREYLRAWHDRPWSQASDEDRAAVMDVLARVSA